MEFNVGIPAAGSPAIGGAGTNKTESDLHPVLTLLNPSQKSISHLKSLKDAHIAKLETQRKLQEEIESKFYKEVSMKQIEWEAELLLEIEKYKLEELKMLIKETKYYQQILKEICQSSIYNTHFDPVCDRSGYYTTFPEVELDFKKIIYGIKTRKLTEKFYKDNLRHISYPSNLTIAKNLFRFEKVQEFYSNLSKIVYKEEEEKYRLEEIHKHELHKIILETAKTEIQFCIQNFIKTLDTYTHFHTFEQINEYKGSVPKGIYLTKYKCDNILRLKSYSITPNFEYKKEGDQKYNVIESEIYTSYEVPNDFEKYFLIGQTDFLTNCPICKKNNKIYTPVKNGIISSVGCPSGCYIYNAIENKTKIIEMGIEKYYDPRDPDGSKALLIKKEKEKLEIQKQISELQFKLSLLEKE